MHPREITILENGAALLIEWADGSRSRFSGRMLRSTCSCNRCASERHSTSALHIPLSSVQSDAERIVSVDLPSSSRLSIVWGDRHEGSFFRFAELLELGERLPPVESSE